MKKALLLIVGILAVSLIIGNIDYLAQFFNTMATGALLPMLAAVVLMLARHLVQAASYDAAFDAVGHATGFLHNVILIFSLVFINTFCLFSGATGVAFIIDDARRSGCDPGQSTGGAILSQIGYFAAVFVISVIGFLTMWISGHMNTVFLVGGLLLAGVLVALSSLFFIGRLRPQLLYRLFGLLERPVGAVARAVRHPLAPEWGQRMGASFETTSGILAENPRGTAVTVAYASFSAILNMLCLVAIGYAFGFEHVEALVAAFAVGAISVIISPTPQGVGVVEAMITAILTAYGCSVATAAAIAIVYRGVMFWIPFCIGAVMLSQAGFFRSDKKPSEAQKDKDTAWISGTILAIIGLVNIVLAFFPAALTPYTALTNWVDISSLMVGVPLVLSSLFLMACAVGLVLRLRLAWAISLGAAILIAGCEMLFRGTWYVAVTLIAFAFWLFGNRGAFDHPLEPAKIRERIRAFVAERREARKKRGEKVAAEGRREEPGPGKRGDEAADGERREEVAPEEHREDAAAVGRREKIASCGREKRKPPAKGAKQGQVPAARLQNNDEIASPGSGK